MGKYQLGEDIPPHAVDAIASFLASLAGPAPVADAHAAR
jgi:hypothetical protein